MDDFLQAVTEAFKSLLTRGILRIDSSGYDAQGFGNAFVVLVGKNFQIRMIRDRGEVFADADSSLYPDDWFTLQQVVRAVGVSSPPPEGLLTPEQAAEIVERYLDDLDSGLGSSRIEQTKKALADLERLAIKRLVDGAKGPRG